jgi:hypothetical protein
MLDAEQLGECQHKLCNVDCAILPKAARIEVMLGCSAMLQNLTVSKDLLHSAVQLDSLFEESSVRTSPVRLGKCKGWGRASRNKG